VSPRVSNKLCRGQILSKVSGRLHRLFGSDMDFVLFAQSEASVHIVIWHLELHKCESSSLKLALQLADFVQGLRPSVYRLFSSDMDFNVSAQSASICAHYYVSI